MLEKLKEKNHILAGILSSVVENIFKQNLDKIKYNKETEIFEIPFGPDKRITLKLDEENKRVKVTFKRVFLNDDRFVREEKEIATISLPERYCQQIVKILKTLKELFDSGKGK